MVGVDAELTPASPRDLSRLDDRALAEAARREPEAFAVLYQRHVSAIHRFARRGTGSATAADDICSTTFERAWRAIGRFRWQRGGFGAWLHRIAANEIASFHRDRHRHTTVRAQRAQRRLSDPVRADATADAAITDADGADVRAAIARLRPRYREALWLRFYAELSPAEAAEVHGTAPGTESVLVHRALKALERELGR